MTFEKIANSAMCQVVVPVATACVTVLGLMFIMMWIAS